MFTYTSWAAINVTRLFKQSLNMVDLYFPSSTTILNNCDASSEVCLTYLPAAAPAADASAANALFQLAGTLLLRPHQLTLVSDWLAVIGPMRNKPGDQREVCRVLFSESVEQWMANRKEHIAYYAHCSAADKSLWAIKCDVI